jgi:enoyl-CoA hydratase/carnithine racemase
MPAPKVLVDRRGPVSVLTLNRPEVHNCIDAETAARLAEAIEAFRLDETARVLVVTGAGDRAFCSGADLKDIEAVMARAAGGRGAPLGFADLEPGKPRIAAVEGWCIAGGIELACWCDLTVAGEGAVFAALNRRWGVPWVDGGTQRMTRRVGTGNALYLVETGEPVAAGQALSIGLVQEVVPSGTALRRALQLAERVAAYPQRSLLSDREAVLSAPGLSLEPGLRLEAELGRGPGADDELREGVRRFAERTGEDGASGPLHP